MKRTTIPALILALAMTLGLTACSNGAAPGEAPTPSAAPVPTSTLAAPTATPQPAEQIYLYGEQHAVQAILDKELELWSGYYNDQDMRHLFIENPYYTAEFLNLWMKSDNDDILDAIYKDWEGSLSYNPIVKDFYKQIKSNCPETIFHGTDVGHRYESIGKRFLEYLESNNLKDSEQYLRTQEVIEQGEHYYQKSDDVYRENKMVENFIYEYDKLSGESIMGIYGSAHTSIMAMEYVTGTVPCMANQLNEKYSGILHTEDLSVLSLVTEPQRVDTIQVAGKDYTASYFGKEDLTGFKNYSTREFWRLENAYEDFKGNHKGLDSLPYDNYPMAVEAGQVFIIDYTMTDGSVNRMYYRADEGELFQGTPTTKEFKVD